MSDYVPKFLPGDSVTITASATILGGQLVTTGGAVAGATALDVAGVAAFDAVSGQLLTVYRVGIHRLICGTGGLTKGQPVKAGAAGTVVLWVSGTDLSGSYLGRAWSTATATNAADVALFGC